MTEPAPHRTEHDITVQAPAADVYRLLAEVENWPRILPPTVYVDRVERSERSERIRIWATANGEVKTWTSRRELDPVRRRIEFRQEVTQPPVREMSGTWLIEPAGPGASRVVLLHEFRALGDDPAGVDWITRAVDGNSTTELAALKANVEAVTGDRERLTFSFEDSVAVDGAAKDVYDFLADAEAWSERLPHVARVRVTEDTPGLQVLEMDTRTKDGSTHTTKSVRVCFPHQRIVYKQTALPVLMTLHTGVWTIADGPGDVVTATSQHTVRINEDAIVGVLGPDAGLEDATRFVRDALGTNSLATLGRAKAYAEQRR